jgi:hypothetical protein
MMKKKKDLDPDFPVDEDMLLDEPLEDLDLGIDDEDPDNRFT